MFKQGHARNIFKSNYHYLLLTLFFVLHAWNDFFELLPAAAILKIFLLLGLVAVVYFLTGLILLKNAESAALFTTISFFLFLFFGVIEKFFFSLSGQITGILPKIVTALFVILLFVLFKRKKKHWIRAVLFINTLLVLLIVLEMVFLLNNAFNSKIVVKKSFLYAGSHPLQKLPTVYLVLLDEYAGAETLLKRGYNNEKFLSEIKSFGFRVIKNAKSNYSYTVPSVASLLNGDIISLPQSKSLYNSERYRLSLKEIYNNRVIWTFRALGYRIENYSPFPMHQANARYTNRFIPVDIGLILSPTIFDDIIDLMPLYITRRLPGKKYFERLVYKKIEDNYFAMDKLLQKAAVQDSTPSFIYVHLMMPHSPFAVDSTGKINVQFLTKKQITQPDKNEAYLQYLVHTNHVVLKFIKQLKAKTNNDAVILLMSDHGSRDLAIGLNDNASFNSLNCIYYPGKDSTGWYDGMSNVNQFRILFSEITGTQIPLLKDSVVLF